MHLSYKGTRVFLFKKVFRIDKKTHIPSTSKYLQVDKKVAVVEYLSFAYLHATSFYDRICLIQCCKCCLFIHKVLFKVVDIRLKVSSLNIPFSRSRFQGWIVTKYHNILTILTSWLLAKVQTEKGILLSW